MVGSHTKAKIVKNKVAPPFKTAEFDIMYGKGISATGEILDLAVQFDIVKKSGAWFYYNEDRIGQGRDNVKNVLEENAAMLSELKEKVIAAMKEKREAELLKKPKKEEAPVISEPTEAPKPRTTSKINLDVDVED